MPSRLSPRPKLKFNCGGLVLRLRAWAVWRNWSHPATSCKQESRRLKKTVESLQSKIANGEKSKSRMQADLEEISMEYERTHAAAIITEKRGRNFDKVIRQ